MGQQEVDFRQIPQEKSFSEAASHVCGYFRSVALDSSRLVVLPLCCVKAYCERSRSAPLSILVRLDEAWTGDIVAVASVFELFHLFADHAPRWHVLSLALVRDPSPPPPVVDFFSRQSAPKLRFLALSVATVSGSLTSNHSMGLGYPLFFPNAPHLSLVRFRGFAPHLMSPPPTRIEVLHLDYPPGRYITYEALRGLLTTLAGLQHLSIDGDIVQNYPRSMSPTTAINLPSLLSLRLACKDGKLYLGILLNIQSPRLRRLILKEVRNGNLERRGTTVSFPQVTELVFIDFDLSAESYRHLWPCFLQSKHFAPLGPQWNLFSSRSSSAKSNVGKDLGRLGRACAFCTSALTLVTAHFHSDACSNFAIAWGARYQD
ncbi:hypothetical protein FA13DRAFT_1739547 [Coprinellus micaceus]|uniref:F-box domain-containing protein n=1 Tax=Coprinellus micaceus TaxID=71717 RepID=A0A4Y7SPU1_COPMI|nr:hypothetical protein FA13DRAFT_1739547 [Coprinellus micaceus]